MGFITRIRSFIKGFFEEDIWRSSTLRLWLLGIFFFVAFLAVFLLGLLPEERVDLEVGQISKRDIFAPRSIVDRPRTDKAREDAGRAAVEKALQSSEFYEVSQAASIKAEEIINTIFMYVDEVFQEIYGNEEETENEQVKTRDPKVLIPLSAESLRKKLNDEYNLEFSNKTLLGLLSLPWQEIEVGRNSLLDIVTPIMEKERIDEDNLSTMKNRLDIAVDSLEIPEDLRAFIRQIGKHTIWPNLVLSTEKVERERQRVMKEVPPTMILNGQKILGIGDPVTADDIVRLQDLGLLRQTVNIFPVIGMILFVLGLLALVTIYMYQFNKEMLSHDKLIALFGIIVIGITALGAITKSLPWEWSPYIVPVAFGTMMITVLINSRLAILASVVIGLLVGVLIDNSIELAIVTMVGGMIGAYSVSRVSQRSDLVRAGFIVGLANIVSITTLGLMYGDPFLDILLHGVIGVLNGILSSILTLGFLPFAEHIFGITSSIKLLEISNPNHPLLKKLMVSAPGTYHHSIIVGNLAEAAAESVNANPLLVRVGAHYHDVGKIKRPYHFIENQFMGDNPHDKFSPFLSALIITSHVKDGVELAKEYKLPEPIIDIVREHHGTTMVSYFYRKALENGQSDSVVESDFRYEGPRPQTKEAAIVMLADAAEAAVRSIRRPEAGQIEEVVRKIVKDRLNDGQFDECEITLRDLDKIANSFVNVLAGIFHSRIEYPDKLIHKEELMKKRSRKKTSKKTSAKN